MVVSKNGGTPKWMVKIMENPIKTDDLGGKHPLFLETPKSNFKLGSPFRDLPTMAISPPPP